MLGVNVFIYPFNAEPKTRVIVMSTRLGWQAQKKKSMPVEFPGNSTWVASSVEPGSLPGVEQELFTTRQKPEIRVRCERGKIPDSDIKEVLLTLYI